MINDLQSGYVHVEVASHCISSFTARMDVYIILEVVASPYHLASLG